MSHYFDDESALEELLNQQLDRAKRVSDINANRKIQSRPQPNSASTQPPQVATPTRDKNKHDTSGQDEVGREEVTTNSRFASWLDGSTKRVQSIPFEMGTAPEQLNDVPGLNSSSRLGSLANPSDEESLEHSLREVKLQEMSKQRLIKLILNQIVPVLNDLKQTGGKELNVENKRLKVELGATKEALDEAQRKLNKQIQFAEDKWTSIIKKLEDKVERYEQELDSSQRRQREFVEELEKDQRTKLKELEESFRLRLDEEQSRWETILKRRDEYYTLELESKVKTGLELEKVDDLFSEVNRTIQGSATDMKLQLKLLKDTLERQKKSVIVSNDELASKTGHLAEHYDKFELQVSQLSGSARDLSELLPKLIKIHNESQSSRDEIKKELSDLARRQRELDEQQAELLRRKDELTEARFQCGIKENELVVREGRLEDQMLTYKDSLKQLEIREKRLEEEEFRLRSQRTNLDIKGADMKQLNLELHLSRQKLENQREELNKAETILAGERQVVEGQWRRLRSEWSRLSGLGKKIQGELKQLASVEKTLVCSVCLERLLPPVARLSKEEDNNKWCVFASHQSVTVNQLMRRRNPEKGTWSARGSGEEMVHEKEKQLDEEDSDGRQLEEETRYARLVDAY